MEDFELPHARPEFAHLSEAEVLRAIEADDQSPIAMEVTRLVGIFFAAFKVRAGAPRQVVHICAACPIERVALLMLLGFAIKEMPDIQH